MMMMKVVAVPQNMKNVILMWTNAHFWVFETLKLSYKCIKKSESRKLTYTLRKLLAFQNLKNINAVVIAKPKTLY